VTLSAGTRLGPYEILAPLGAGGMGEVYKARDVKLGRQVAIKVLPDAMSRDGDRLARFEREARSLAALNHPNIVTIYAVEESGQTRFLAMELVEGRSLDLILAERALDLPSFLDLAVPLADALSAAHERGIVHRDLKPGNVMVTAEGRVKVLDFGLARLDSAPSDPELSNSPTQAGSDLTSEGQVFGTVAYMSPEQARGDRVDARSDVFSLGIVLYQMLTGARPFAGASAVDTISAILRDTPVPLADRRADLPPHLGRVVRRCLEKDPRNRYQTSRDVYNELRELRGEVSAPSAASVAPPPTGRGQSPVAWIAAAAGALAVAIGLIVLTRSRTPGAAAPAAGAIRSIAVLPLDNYSGDSSQDYFAEGMTDELTSDLANISGLRVISRGSAMQFAGKKRPPTPEIAKTLDVDAVVEGSVIRSGDRVRINAQLIDARSDRHLWAKSFERSSKDVLALQDELAAAIANEIHVTLTPAEESRLAKGRTVKPDAYDAYLKGRYFFNRPSDENLSKAIALFEKATGMDASYAPAFSGLSDALLWAGYNEGVLTGTEARPKAKAAAEKAIALDPESAEAHTSLANFKLWYEYDWAGCEAEFRRAIELNPNYAFAHDQFGIGLSFQGRFDEAIAAGKRAAALDPLSPQIPLDATMAYGFKGDYEAGRKLTRRAAELDPTFFFAPFEEGWLEIQAGRLPEAIANLRKAKAMDSPAFVSAFLAYAYAASGDRASATSELADLTKRSLRGTPTAFNLALASIGLGDRAGALNYLEKAYASDSQWLGWLKFDKAFDTIRSEPRFQALLTKIGLAGPTREGR